MATLKQMKMLAAKSKAAGMKYDFDSFKGLENGEVDEKLAEIAAFKPVQQPAPKQQPPQAVRVINGMRFGMCLKLVVENSNLDAMIAHKSEFKARVEELYNVVTEIEEAVSASSSSTMSMEEWRKERREHMEKYHPEVI